MEFLLLQEPKQFNDFLLHLYKFSQEKDLKGFCDYLTSNRVTLISKTEAADRSCYDFRTSTPEPYFLCFSAHKMLTLSVYVRVLAVKLQKMRPKLSWLNPSQNLSNEFECQDVYSSKGRNWERIHLSSVSLGSCKSLTGIMFTMYQKLVLARYGIFFQSFSYQ